MLNIIRKLIPRRLMELARPAYHYSLACIAAIIYRFPARNLVIIGITGTKGKTSTAEMINAMLEAAGKKTALAGTLHFKIAGEERKNLYKMSMPGRFFMQKFLREAVNRGCQYAIIEMTSEGAKLNRHAFIYMDALVFTNIAKEHIESHGSFNNYVLAKVKLAKALEKSPKRPRLVVANADDAQSYRFLNIKVEEKIPFHLNDASPYKTSDDGISLTAENRTISSHLQGEFNIYNLFAAIKTVRHFGISFEDIENALNSLSMIRGRMEKITLSKENPLSDKQAFTVIVDYAHTPDSLEQAYKVYKDKRKICIIGNTGGGRDKWKRPEMAGIAEKYCDEIILANEDPYEEDPMTILNEMAAGIKDKTKLSIILDRRQAINTALSRAKPGDVVMITGKGTDPYIMEAKGKKTEWDDAVPAKLEIDLKKGDESASVFYMQRALQKIGTFPAPGYTERDCSPNGVFGPCTEEAVKTFQRKYGLPQSGYVGSLTINKLKHLLSNTLAF